MFALNRHIFKKIKRKADYQHTGASLLLGVNAPLLVAHGCSNALAIENALLRAHELVKQKFVTQFNAQLAIALKNHSLHYEDSSLLKRTVKSVLRLQ